MMMLEGMPGALPDALRGAYANSNAVQAMHGRTDGRTNEELTYVRHKTSPFITHTRVQNLLNGLVGA